MTKIKQDALEKNKRIVSCDILLTYPYFSKTFKINTNGIDLQLGAFISQKGIPIDCCSRKRTESQEKVYSTREGITKHC